MAQNRGQLGEYCRRLVVKLLQSGKLPVETADVVGLSQSGVSRIWTRFEEEGEEGLAARHSPGAPPKLDASSKAKLPERLSRGPQAYGFEGNLWTRRRVQRVIQEQFGVSYSEGHVGTLLKEMGCSPQQPRRRDHRQNLEPVHQWKTEPFPALKPKREKRRGY